MAIHFDVPQRAIVLHRKAYRQSIYAPGLMPAAARVIRRGIATQVFLRIGNKCLVTDFRTEIIFLSVMLRRCCRCLGFHLHFAYWIDSHVQFPFHVDDCHALLVLRIPVATDPKSRHVRLVCRFLSSKALRPNMSRRQYPCYSSAHI